MGVKFIYPVYQYTMRKDRDTQILRMEVQVEDVYIQVHGILMGPFTYKEGQKVLRKWQRRHIKQGYKRHGKQKDFSAS